MADCGFLKRQFELRNERDVSHPPVRMSKRHVVVAGAASLLPGSNLQTLAACQANAIAQMKKFLHNPNTYFRFDPNTMNYDIGKKDSRFHHFRISKHTTNKNGWEIWIEGLPNVFSRCVKGPCQKLQDFVYDHFEYE